MICTRTVTVQQDLTSIGRINQAGCLAIMWLWSHKYNKYEDDEEEAERSMRKRMTKLVATIVSSGEKRWERKNEMMTTSGHDEK